MPNKTANKDLTSSIEDVLEAGDAIHLHTVTGVEIGKIHTVTVQKAQ